MIRNMVYEEEVKKVLNYFENQNLIDDLLSRICFSVNYDYEINFEGSYEDPDWLPITCHDVDLPGDSPFVDKFSVELTKTIIIAFDKSVKKECEKETYQARGKMADYERKYKESNRSFGPVNDINELKELLIKNEDLMIKICLEYGINESIENGVEKNNFNNGIYKEENNFNNKIYKEENFELIEKLEKIKKKIEKLENKKYYKILKHKLSDLKLERENLITEINKGVSTNESKKENTKTRKCK